MNDKSTGKSYYNSKNINRKDQSNRMNISIRLIIRGCDLYMSELAYSLHLGSDKNRKNVSRARAKSNASGTTSLVKNLI